MSRGLGAATMAEVEWEAGRKRVLVKGLRDNDALELLAQTLHDLINDRQIQGVRSITNLSTENRLLLVVELTSEADDRAVLDELHKHIPTDE
jgi:DNA gyrase/topoisomerase IV subunit A